MKQPYTPFVFYKQDCKFPEFNRSVCFSSVDLSILKVVRYYIDDSLNEQIVSDYFNFLKSIFDFDFEFTFDTVENSTKTTNTLSVVDISLDLSSFSRVKSLTILTLLRYIQEFPEIVEKAAEKEINWESFQEGHKHWNEIRGGKIIGTRIKYDNAYGHAIGDGLMYHDFCSLEEFKLKFNKAQAGYVRELFKKSLTSAKTVL